jgi:signal transduction histidine kinase
MLVDFIRTHRADLIAQTREKVAARSAPKPSDDELLNGVPLFLDQFVVLLQHDGASTDTAMAQSATVHGATLRHLGYTVGQVVHDYGDVCQAITELAQKLDAPITTDEFHSLNLCLDNAIAGAVTEFVRLHDESVTAAETERSGAFAHELRNKISAAKLGFQAIQTGRAPANGSVAAMVTRSLHAMTDLVNVALVEVRVDSGNVRAQRVALNSIIEQAAVEGAMDARARGKSLDVAPLDQLIEVDADPQVLAGALANILQNALKYTRAGGHVSLRAGIAGKHVDVEVEDQCGGLPPGRIEDLFAAFHQRNEDRTGLGLGLSISRKGVEAFGGFMRVRDLPGIGCVFTIELPLSSPAVAV